MKPLLEAFPSLRAWKRRRPLEFVSVPELGVGKHPDALLLSALPDDCRVLLQVRDGDAYRGDSRLLLRCEGRFAVSVLGWGSCSGCDALLACRSLTDLEQLRQDLLDQMVWRDSAAEMLDYFLEHDWRGDFGAKSLGQQQFVTEAITLLERLSQQPDPDLAATAITWLSHDALRPEGGFQGVSLWCFGPGALADIHSVECHWTFSVNS